MLSSHALDKLSAALWQQQVQGNSLASTVQHNCATACYTFVSLPTQVHRLSVDVLNINDAPPGHVVDLHSGFVAMPRTTAYLAVAAMRFTSVPPHQY